MRNRMMIGLGGACAVMCAVMCTTRAWADGTAVESAAGGLPEDCVPIEYVQGNGSSKMVLDGYVPRPQTDSIEVVFELTTDLANQALWCSRVSLWHNADSWTAWVLNDGSLRCDYNTSRSAFSCNRPLKTGVRYTVFASNSTCRVSNGSAVDYLANESFTEAGGPLMLFASYTTNSLAHSDNCATYKLYSFKVWRSGALLHDCVPYRQDANRTVGLYDVAAGRDLSRYGSVKFIAGPDCATNLSVQIAGMEVAGPGAVPPSPVVTDGATGRTLVQGMDYVVDYEQTGDAAVGKAVVKSRVGSGAAGWKSVWHSIRKKAPEGWTRLEWIQGDGQAKLLTDYVPRPTTDVVSLEYSFSVLETVALMCARESASGGQRKWAFHVNPQGSFSRFDYGSEDIPKGSVSLSSLDARYTATLSNRCAIVSNGDWIESGATDDVAEAGGPLMFFGFYRDLSMTEFNTVSHHRMHGCTVRRDGALLHDWIPARRESDGLVTLLDLVTGEAVEPIGDGEFLAGPECPADLAVRIGAVPVQTWDGETPCAPALDVRAAATGRRLVAGEDYEVAYSGNAAAGVATAKVTGIGGWAGMSATVPFAVVNALPDGYTPLAYIQGDGKSRLLTDWTVRPWTDRIEAEVEFTERYRNAAIWCARGTKTNERSTTLFQLAGGNFRNDYDSVVQEFALNADVRVGRRYRLVSANGRLTLGDVAASAVWPRASFTEAGGPLALFASYVNGTGSAVDYYSTHRLFEFSIWRDGTLVRMYVPVKNPAGVATLYDVVQGVELSPLGAGAFIAGPAKAEFDLFVRNQPWDGVKDVRPAVAATNRTTGAELARGIEYRTSAVCDAEAGSGRVTAVGVAGSSYAGQETTADFEIYPALPEGFERLEWIQGDGKSVLQTAYLPNPQTDRVQVDWAVEDEDMAGFFCARDAATETNSWSFCLMPGALSGRFDYKDASARVWMSNWYSAIGCGVRHRLVVDGARATMENGYGEKSATADEAFTEAGGRMCIFGYYKKTEDNFTSRSRLRIYDFKVWRSGVLLHHWIPARTDAGVVTLYDAVDGAALVPGCLPGGAFRAGPVWPVDPLPPPATVIILR